MPKVKKRLSKTEIAVAIRSAKPQNWHKFRTAVANKGMSRTEVGKAWRMFHGVYTDEKLQESHDTFDSVAADGAKPTTKEKGEVKDTRQ